MDEDVSASLDELSQNILAIGSNINAWQNYRDQREDLYKFYYDQRYLSLPSTQMQLRAAAGLNPYGDFNYQATGQPTPVQSQLPQTLNSAANAFASSAARKITKASQRLTLAQIELEQQKVANQTKIAEQQAKYLASQVTFQDIANIIARLTAPNVINLKDEEVTSAILNNGVLAKTFTKIDDLNDAQIRNLIAAANASDASAENSRAGAAYSRAQIDRLNALLPHEVDKLKYEASKAEIDAAESLMIDNLIEQFHLPDNSKPAIKGLLNLFYHLLNKN